MWICVKTQQLGFRSLISAPEGGFGYQHLPEWVCDEVAENQLQKHFIPSLEFQ